MITEKQFLNTVRETALRAGWKFYHTHDSRRSDPGFPDIVMVKNGYILFIELKVGKGKLTPAQADWIAKLGVPAPYVMAQVLRPAGFDKFWQDIRKI